MSNTYNSNQQNNQLTTNPYSFVGSTTGNSVLTITPENPASLRVDGKMILNGIDLEERITTLEKVLMIPERDSELENKYPKLKKMYDEYIKELLKARTWEKLKNE
jgi:hypothetical protein